MGRMESGARRGRMAIVVILAHSPPGQLLPFHITSSSLLFPAVVVSSNTAKISLVSFFALSFLHFLIIYPTSAIFLSISAYVWHPLQ